MVHPDAASVISLPPVFYTLVVIGLGLLLGDIPFPGGFKLGVAGILFSGLILGAFLPGQKIPPVLLEIGLILFVYGVGLQTGPGFFRSFKKDGLKLNLAVLVSLLAAFLICAVIVLGLGQNALTMAGLFCGALTNTPALGAATETLENTGASQDEVNSVVVGYAIAYPFAILGVLLILQFGVWLSRRGGTQASVDKRLNARTIEITAMQDGRPWTVQALETAFQVRVTRLRLSDASTNLQGEDMALVPGSLVTVVGSPTDVEKLLQASGKASDTTLQTDPSKLDVTDLRVSNRKVCGRPIRELEARQEGLIISRVRRGDVEMAASPTLLLQPGDEVRVVSDHTKLAALNALFGNSTTALSESCYLTFVLGIVLGLLVGMIPIPIPGLSAPLHLGMAGGPLIVGILLGWLGRTGPLVWSMPHEVNLGIRHFGLLLFLAGAGANAGASLPSALESEGPALMLFAVIVVLSTHAIGWLVMKMAGERDLAVMMGVLSGLQTQPAALSFAAARVQAEKVQIGYTAVFPLAIILKIILAQLLLELAKR